MPDRTPPAPGKNIRLARHLYEASNRIYSFTICAFRKSSPFVNEELNETVLRLLKNKSAEMRCRVFTYCLMPDHLHFLVSPRSDGVSVLDFIDRFKGGSTNVSWQHGWKGKLWEPRYYDRIVRKNEDLLQLAAYMLNNPVRKGLVGSKEDWPWSGHINSLPLV